MPPPAALAGHWNHNTHYYPLALEHTPCDRALDVGCGDGLLLTLLADRCAEVVGIDPSPVMVEQARERCASRPDVIVHETGLLRCGLPDESFDLVTAHATLHHMSVELGLRRLADLVRPGGWLVVVGVAQNSTPGDLVADGVGFFAHRVLGRRYGYWEHPAPVQEPTMSHHEVHRLVRETLPGVRWRRHVLFRHSITWQRPAV